MVNAAEILEHMEVVGSDGQHVGTVDHMQDGQIKLTRTDSTDGQHHMLPLSAAGSIEAGKLKLTMPAKQAMSMQTAAG